MPRKLLNRSACILLFPCLIHASVGFAAETVSVGLTEEEKRTVRDTQAQILREAEGKLLRHLQADVERPAYPLSDLVSLVDGERAVAELARLLSDPKFQSKPAHIKILNALAQVQIDGAGKQVAAMIRQGIYKDDASMLSTVVAAFSPAEVKAYGKDLMPYLNHKNTLLRTLVAYRLAAAGVEDAKAQFVRLITNPDRYVESVIMNTLTDFDEKVGLLALSALEKTTSEESKYLIALIVLASGIKDRPKAIQAIVERIQLGTQPMPVTDGRKTRAAEAAIQSLLLHEKYRNWIAGNEEPLLFSIEDVGLDFRVPGRRIRLIRYAHIRILRLQDKALSIRALDRGQDSILISVGFGPIMKRGAIRVTLKEKEGEYSVASIEHRPGK